MKRRLAIAAPLFLAGLLALRLLPVAWLAAPQWEVTVVDDQGKPIEGMTVRETWQNFSVEMQGHLEDRQTDAEGYVAFPARNSEYSVLRQIEAALSQLGRFSTHSGYGPYATVFAFGKGFEGGASSGDRVIDWTGFPPDVQSLIVVNPATLPEHEQGDGSH